MPTPTATQPPRAGCSSWRDVGLMGRVTVKTPWVEGIRNRPLCSNGTKTWEVRSRSFSPSFCAPRTMSLTNPTNPSRASSTAVRSNACAKARRVAVRRSGTMRLMAWARAAAAYLAKARSRLSGRWSRETSLTPSARIASNRCKAATNPGPLARLGARRSRSRSVVCSSSGTWRSVSSFDY
jgi:hypothetical protein